MNDDITYLIQYCILDLQSYVKPEFDVWRNCISKNPNEDPLGWLYWDRAEIIIKK